MSHTPGPWTFGTTRKDSNFSKTLVGIVTTPRGNVARTYPVFTGNREEVEANTNLIAAAPELLEALREAVPFLVAEADHADITGRCCAAIAKAEGK